MIYCNDGKDIIIEMGNGDVGVSTLSCENGGRAIGFSILSKRYDVGCDCKETESTNPDDMPVKLLFKNKESAEVVLFAITKTIEKFEMQNLRSKTV